MKICFSVFFTVMLLFITSCESKKDKQEVATTDTTANVVDEDTTEEEIHQIVDPKQEAVRFLYNTFYNKKTIKGEEGIGRYSWSGYSQAALDKFKELGINSELDYPVDTSQERAVSSYEPYYSKSLNTLLKSIWDELERTDDTFMMECMGGCEESYDGDTKFNLEIKNVDVVSPEKVIVKATENKGSYVFTYVLVKEAGRWYIDDIYDFREMAKEILHN